MKKATVLGLITSVLVASSTAFAHDYTVGQTVDMNSVNVEYSDEQVKIFRDSTCTFRCESRSNRLMEIDYTANGVEYDEYIVGTIFDPTHMMNHIASWNYNGVQYHTYKNSSGDIVRIDVKNGTIFEINVISKLIR